VIPLSGVNCTKIKKFQVVEIQRLAEGVSFHSFITVGQWTDVSLKEVDMDNTNVQLSYMTVKNQTLKHAANSVLLNVKETKPTSATENVFLQTNDATKKVSKKVNFKYLRIG
jgi:hypothetical protein